MEKFLKITVEEKDDKVEVTWEKEGITTFEAIGLLTYFRDKIETDAMFANKNNKENDPPGI